MPASITIHDNSGQHGPEIDEAKERKRLQNRIAQRKFRERKAQQQMLANAAAANTIATQGKPIQDIDMKNASSDTTPWVGKSCPFINLPISPPTNTHASSAEHPGQSGEVKRDFEKSSDAYQCEKCGKRLFSILGDSCACALAGTSAPVHQVQSPLGSHSGLTPPHDISRVLKASGRDDEFPFETNRYHVAATMDMARDVIPAPHYMSEGGAQMPMHPTHSHGDFNNYSVPSQVPPQPPSVTSVSHYSEDNSAHSMSDMVCETISNAQVMDQPLLHVAASNGHYKIVQMLIDHKFDINEQDSHGMTALHVAVRHGREDVVRLLLQNGANAYIKDQDGQSPLHLAVQTGFENAVGMFLANGIIRSSPS